MPIGSMEISEAGHIVHYQAVASSPAEAGEVRPGLGRFLEFTAAHGKFCSGRGWKGFWILARLLEHVPELCKDVVADDLAPSTAKHKTAAQNPEVPKAKLPDC